MLLTSLFKGTESKDRAQRYVKIEKDIVSKLEACSVKVHFVPYLLLVESEIERVKGAVSIYIGIKDVWDESSSLHMMLRVAVLLHEAGHFEDVIYGRYTRVKKADERSAWKNAAVLVRRHSIEDPEFDEVFGLIEEASLSTYGVH